MGVSSSTGAGARAPVDQPTGAAPSAPLPSPEAAKLAPPPAVVRQASMPARDENDSRPPSANRSPVNSRPPSARLPQLPPRSRAPRTPAVSRQSNRSSASARPHMLRNASAPAALFTQILPQLTKPSAQFGKLRDTFSPQLLARFPTTYRFGRLGGTEATWLRSKMIFRGTYGRISMGRLAGQPNSTKVAIKETHAYAKAPKEKTRTLSVQAAQEEAWRTRYIRECIESAVPHLEAQLWGEGANPLWGARRGQQKSVVFDDFADDDGRYYLITTLELGAADDLLDCLPANLRTLVTASYITQVGLELAATHQESDFAHLDLTLANVSFNGFGQFKVMDFGLAQSMDRNEVGIRAIPYGAIAAPEMLPPTDDGRAAASPFTAKIDYFSFAVSAWQMLAGADVKNPFEWAYFAKSDAVDVASTRAHSAESAAVDVASTRASLQAWQRVLDELPKDIGGRPCLPRDGMGGYPRNERGTFDVTKLPLVEDKTVRRFLHRGIQRAPQLAELLLQALVAEPSARLSPLALAKATAAHLPAVGTAEQVAMYDFWAKREADGIYHDVFADADVFEHMLAVSQLQKPGLK